MRRPHAFLAGLVSLAIGASIARADCAQTALPDEIRGADVIVVASLTRVEGGRATFRVHDVYKGAAGPYITIATNPRRFSVVQEQVGRRFVLLLRRSEPATYHADGCGSSGTAVDRVVAELERAGLRATRPHVPRPG
ncbi:MAG: hypothetical protein AB7S26_25225 [Sandaracinaceae bacterium]